MVHNPTQLNKDTSSTQSLGESEVSNNRQQVEGNETTSVSLAGEVTTSPVNISITKEQREEMLHAIGLNYSDKPYRNKFYTQCTDSKWLDLEAKGLADHTNGWEKDMWYFYLTKEGFKFLGIDITNKRWEDL